MCDELAMNSRLSEDFFLEYFRNISRFGSPEMLYCCVRRLSRNRSAPGYSAPSPDIHHRRSSRVRECPSTAYAAAPGLFPQRHVTVRGIEEWVEISLGETHGLEVGDEVGEHADVGEAVVVEVEGLSTYDTEETILRLRSSE